MFMQIGEEEEKKKRSAVHLGKVPFPRGSSWPTF